MNSGERAPIAVVQEAACAERVVVLKVRIVGSFPDGASEGSALPKTSLVVVGSPAGGTPNVGLLTGDERRALWGSRLPAGFAPQKARADALVHARIISLGKSEVFIEQQGLERVVRAQQGRVIVTDERAPTDGTPFLSLSVEERASLAARGLELAQALADSVVVTRRADVLRILEKASERIARRRSAVSGDLEKIGQADRIAEQAEWLVPAAARAERGATKLVATDWSTGEAVPIEIPLDPSKSAKEQVAAMFKRAKRLRLGGTIARERLEQASKQLAALQVEIDAARAATTLVALEEGLLRAKRAAPRDVALPSTAASATGKKEKKDGGTQTRRAYRTFVARSGRKLLLGKGAADNDALTLRVARPHDLWLHAKDRTGAHVIVLLDRGQTCSAEDLVDGAHLAAHFSDARDEKVVDVQYTERRYLRKPKGSAPGFVIVDREKVLVLRIERDLLPTLLEREEV